MVQIYWKYVDFREAVFLNQRKKSFSSNCYVFGAETLSGISSTECFWKSFNLAGYNLLSTKLGVINFACLFLESAVLGLFFEIQGLN